VKTGRCSRRHTHAGPLHCMPRRRPKQGRRARPRGCVGHPPGPPPAPPPAPPSRPPGGPHLVGYLERRGRAGLGRLYHIAAVKVHLWLGGGGEGVGGSWIRGVALCLGARPAAAVRPAVGLWFRVRPSRRRPPRRRPSVRAGNGWGKLARLTAPLHQHPSPVPSPIPPPLRPPRSSPWSPSRRPPPAD
jgi:hypothetical protein